MVKDEGKDPSKECQTIAQQFNGDSNVVGVVGAYSSECSVAMQKEFVASSKSHIFFLIGLLQRKKRLQEYTFYFICSLHTKMLACDVVNLSTDG